MNPEQVDECTVDRVVLCVDDAAESLGALRRCLNEEPYEVVTARTALEALGWLKEHPVDVVITDYRMPGTDGIELLAEIRRRSLKTARIILTGYPGDSVIRKGLEVGADTILYKPWDNETLRGTIRRLIARGRRAGCTKRALQDPGDDLSDTAFDVGGEGGFA